MKTKERILNVTMQMLKNHVDPQNITLRDIADKAKVNLALINYHFESKDKLIYMAAGQLLNDITDQLHTIPVTSNLQTAYERLEKTMIDIGDFIFGTYHLSHIAVSEEMKNGSVDTVMIILPVLNEHYKGKKNDTELKLIALQIITPLQVLFLNASSFKSFIYMDMFDKTDRDNMIRMIIKHVIGV